MDEKEDRRKRRGRKNNIGKEMKIDRDEQGQERLNTTGGRSWARWTWGARCESCRCSENDFIIN